MTEKEFIMAYRHEIEGWVLEALMERARPSNQVSFFLRHVRSKIEAKLQSMYYAARGEQLGGKK